MAARGGIILAMETSNASAGPGGVAVGRVVDGRLEVLSVDPLTPSGRHDDALMPAIASAMARAGVAPGAVARVAVSVGPGGFSGLRVATATAKMIALASGARCVAVPSALVVALGWFERGDARRRALVALASKRESAWVAAIDAGDDAQARGRSAAGGRVLDGEGLARELEAVRPGALLADERLPAPMRAAAEKAGVAIERPVFDAVACLGAAVELDPVEPAALEPIYPREPEAVRKWRELGR